MKVPCKCLCGNIHESGTRRTQDEIADAEREATIDASEARLLADCAAKRVVIGARGMTEEGFARILGKSTTTTWRMRCLFEVLPPGDTQSDAYFDASGKPIYWTVRGVAEILAFKVEAVVARLQMSARKNANM